MLTTLASAEEAHALEVGALYRRLALLARTDEKTALALDKALEVRLSSRAGDVRSCSMVEVARIWSKARETVDGLSAAAFLWTVARASAPWWRQLESVIVEDVKYMSARSLMSQPLAGACESELSLEAGLAT